MKWALKVDFITFEINYHPPSLSLPVYNVSAPSKSNTHTDSHERETTCAPSQALT